MTVSEMKEKVSNQEFHQWRAFHHYRAEMQKFEYQRAKDKGK